MKKIITIAATFSILLITTLASADQVDFTAKIVNAEYDQEQPTKLVGLLVIDEPFLYSSTRSINYTIIEVDTENQIFTGSTDISIGQSNVTTGNLNTGKVILNYDDVADKLNAKIVIKINPCTKYQVYVSDSGSGHYGVAQILSCQAL